MNERKVDVCVLLATVTHYAKGFLADSHLFTVHLFHLQLFEIFANI